MVRCITSVLLILLLAACGYSLGDFDLLGFMVMSITPEQAEFQFIDYKGVVGYEDELTDENASPS